MRRAVLLLALVAAAAASAQTAEPRFERFGIREGLSSEHIRSITQDSLGFLWIGTRDALNRYDGHGFRVYRLGEAGLPGRQVLDLLVDGQDNLWVATDGGVVVLDRRSGRFRPANLPGAPGAFALALETDADGGIWIGTRGHGLFYRAPHVGRAVEAGPWRRIAVTGDPAQDAVLDVSILVRGTSGIWAEAADGTTNHAGRVWPDRPMTDLLLRSDGGLLGPDQDGRLVLGRTSREIFALAPGDTWQARREIVVRDVGGAAPMWPFAKVGDGRWWLSTPDGLLEWERTQGTVRRIRGADSRQGRVGLGDVQTVFRDRQGGIWVGTTSGLYLSRVRSLPFRTFRHDPDDPATLSDDRVNGLSLGADGQLWVATNAGLNRLDLATGRNERLGLRIEEPATGLPNAFWQVLHARDGETYVGPKAGALQRVAGDRLEPLNAAILDWQANTTVSDWPAGFRTLFQDRSGRIWAGFTMGMQRLDPGRSFTSRVLDDRVTSFGVPGKDRGLTDPRTNVVYESGDGRIWIGTDDGLFTYDEASARARHVGMLCGPAVWAITEVRGDPGALWMSTFGTGLARLDRTTGRVRCVTTEDGMPSDLVYSVAADARGALWAGTAAGLARVELEPGGVPGRVSVFNAEDGIQGDDHNFMAQLRLPDGRLAFGGPAGLTVFDPAAIARRSSDAPTVFTGVEVLGSLRGGVPLPGDTLRLRHDENFFGVRFATLDFRAPGRHRYRYRLAGVDADWRAADAEAPRAAYTDVPPGMYRFEVIGTTHRGDEGSAPAVLVVDVVPAWWQTWWARALAALLVVFAVARGVAWNTRRRVTAVDAKRQEAVEVQRRLADGRERERRRLARDLHDGPVQGLYRVGHDLDALERVAGASAPSIRDTRARLGEISGELREMLGQLRPTLALHLPLPDALDALVARFERRHGVRAETVYQTDAADADGASRLVLFRIAQEALENVARHAGARTVWVTVDTVADGLRLSIEDDGRGFDVPERLVAFAREEHYGLVGMAERAESVGGRFRVLRREGGGTRVEAVVPLRPDAHSAVR